MKVLELNLSEPTVTKLQEAAERLSQSPEELAILSLEEKLAQLDDQYRNAADYVLNKNTELYKRLARCATSPNKLQATVASPPSRSGYCPVSGI